MLDVKMNGLIKIISLKKKNTHTYKQAERVYNQSKTYDHRTAADKVAKNVEQDQNARMCRLILAHSLR